MNFYIGPFQQDKSGVWTIPVPNNASWSALDLSAVGDHSTAIVATAERLPAEYTLLANDWTAAVQQRMRDALPGTNTSNGLTFREVLFDWFLNRSDPDGAACAKPLTPAKGKMSLHVNGHSMDVPFRWGDPGTTRLQALEQAEYSRIRSEAEDANNPLPSDIDQKYLSTRQSKYGTDWKNLTPPNQRDKPPAKPGTQWTDSFTGADSDPLSANWELMYDFACAISGNRATRASGFSANRYLQAVSAADHYVQGDFGDGTFVGGQLLARLSASVQTYYYINFDGNAGYYYAYKRISGSDTLLSYHPSTAKPSGAVTAKIDVTGSTISAYFAGNLEGTDSDSAITSNLLGGFRIQGPTLIDNWIIDDGVSGGGGIPGGGGTSRGFRRGFGRGVK